MVFPEYALPSVLVQYKGNTFVSSYAPDAVLIRGQGKSALT